MTDPIDTALLPCPFCGGEAERITIGDDEPSNAGGDVVSCRKCHASSHVEFGSKENLVSAWNRRATDTARQEGIALGLAMAKACKRYDVFFEEMTIEPDDDGTWIEHSDIPDPPIPPHVAAARVLLDMAPNRDGLHVLPDHMRAALEQIAKGGE